MNIIKIEVPIVKDNTIRYTYEIEGSWTSAFQPMRECTIEYSYNLSNVPSGVAVVPFLANVLPIAWVMDAKVITKVCDADFFYCLEDVKHGYSEMFPMMNFGGEIFAETLQDNRLKEREGSVAFFSGGVDAFNTLTSHYKEKPTLVTLWGADVHLDDEEGWQKVLNHIEETAYKFDTNYVTVKSEFRDFLNECVLQKAVETSGDGWWHGFQHGMGIICHAAPITYVLGKEKVYFASSFTAADKGKVTCASDPTIDNCIRFCGCEVIHDGYEFTRQMKVHNITKFAKETNIKIPLRVCWESSGGSNCCNCEKCWRTILGVYAEGFDPREFGFEYDNLNTLAKKIYKNRELLKWHRESRYAPMQKVLRKNYSLKTVEPALRWFYSMDIERLGEVPLYKKCWRKWLDLVWKVKGKYFH